VQFICRDPFDGRTSVTLDGIETFDDAMKCALISARARRTATAPAALPAGAAAGRRGPGGGGGGGGAGVAAAGGGVQQQQWQQQQEETQRSGGGAVVLNARATSMQAGGGVENRSASAVVEASGRGDSGAGGFSGGSRGLGGLWARGQRCFWDWTRCLAPDGVQQIGSAVA
jgi:hypothetical protein